MLTKYDKAGGAAIGVALSTVVAYFFPAFATVEMQGALGIILGGGFAWLFPNKAV